MKSPSRHRMAAGAKFKRMTAKKGPWSGRALRLQAGPFPVQRTAKSKTKNT